MRPDDVCELESKTPPKLAIRMLDESTMLIEGKKEALRFLGSLLIAVADDPLGDGFQFSPDGSGSAFFSSSSTVGLYLHRVD